jgi:hypothetical protein
MMRLTVFVLSGVSAAAIGGCTFIGFTAGIMIDNQSIHSVEIAKIDSLKPGVWVEISLEDSTERDGHFIGTDGMYRSQYPPRYAEARKNLLDSVRLPVFGSRLSFADTTGHGWTGEFKGFDLTENLDPLLLVKLQKQINPRSFDFSFLKTIADSIGESLDLRTIGRLVKENSIPVASKGVMIRDSTMIRRIDLSDIISAQIDDNPGVKHTTWIAGLIGGLAVDAVCYAYVIPLIVKQSVQ